MKYINDKTLVGERALFKECDATIENCIFEDGESPLKESKNLIISNTSFKWKYPLWYSKNILVTNSRWFETGRSGIWYTNDIEISNCEINAPKQLRRCNNIKIGDTKFTNALETLWNCHNIKISNCYFNGDYLGMNSTDAEIENLTLDGNYFFDGGSNIVVKDSYLNSKDSFWNCKNVVVYNSHIIGEYIGWNSENVTFINCKIESTQGFCYMKNLKLVDCVIENTTLAFEYSTVDATIKGGIESVFNPTSGTIKADYINKLILEEDKVDTTKTKIIAEVKVRV